MPNYDVLQVLVERLRDVPAAVVAEQGDLALNWHIGQPGCQHRLLHQIAQGLTGHVLGSKTGRKRHLFNRWPESTSAQREPRLMRLAAPGPDGAIATVGYELMCEGIQEAEASIVMTEALDKHADKLGPALTGKCRELLVARINACREVYGIGGTLTAYNRGWQERAAKLYQSAAEVSRALQAR